MYIIIKLLLRLRHIFLSHHSHTQSHHMVSSCHFPSFSVITSPPSSDHLSKDSNYYVRTKYPDLYIMRLDNFMTRTSLRTQPLKRYHATPKRRNTIPCGHTIYHYKYVTKLTYVAIVIRHSPVHQLVKSDSSSEPVFTPVARLDIPHGLAC
jgi:hypothetical protein